MQLFFDEKYNLRNKIKDQSNGSLKLDLRNAKLSFRDKKTNQIKDSSAFALAEVKRRSGNRNYIYPNAGNLECTITLKKIDSNKTELIVIFEPTCVMTEFVEDYYVERRRKTPNVEIQSTGVFEKKIQNLLNN